MFDESVPVWMDTLLLIIGLRLIWQLATVSYTAFMALPDGNILAYKPPPNWLIALLAKPLAALFPVKSKGLQNIPSHGRIIFVGNHQNYSMDVPNVCTYIYWNTGIYLRPFVDKIHFRLPFNKHFFTWLGGIEGTRENCETLMKAGCPLLVYPGGASENLKDERIPKYLLLWKDHVGFAKMAAKHNYTIIPFSSVGFEDMFQIWFSIPSYYIFTLLGDSRAKKERALHKQATKNTPPPIPHQTFSKGYKAPPFPDTRIPVYAPWTFRPQSNYCVFGTPIETTNFDADDSESVFALRDVVRDAVEKCVEQAKEMQASDTERFTFRFFGERKEKTK